MKRSKDFIALITLALLLFIPAGLLTQGTRADYERADQLRLKVEKLVFNMEANPNWIGETSSFWYKVNTREGKKFILIDAAAEKQSPAFDQQRLAAALSTASEKKYSAADLPFDEFKFIDNGQAIEFLIDKTKWECVLKDYKCKKAEKTDSTQQNRRTWGRSRHDSTWDMSPDKKRIAVVKDFNIYIGTTETKAEFQLTEDGEEGHFYSSPIWSPDSNKLIAYKVKKGEERQVHYIESSPSDQVQPKHSTRTYAKPGDVLTTYNPVIFDVASKKKIKVKTDLFPTPFINSRLRWRENSRFFTFEYNQRGHQVYRVIEVNASTGEARILIDEQSETFFDYYHKKYRFDVNEGKEIIWMSERDGWNHLYLYDGNTARVKNQITKGKWVVREVKGVDGKNRRIFFGASGIKPDQDPYFINFYSINFDGTGLKELTEGIGNHSADLSPDKKYFVDNYSRVDKPPVSVLRRTSDGKLLMDLEHGDIKDLLATGWKMPEPFCAKGRDGETDIWGIIFRPQNLDKSRKYPIIEYIYAGPHDSYVPKTFRAFRSMQALAELGFILVQIDGMGTNNRSKAFHDVCWKNLKDAGFPDRIPWIKAAAERYPYMDITRVGIYGHSAGGQNSTGAILLYPKFYKVAVSSCGCHDNRMDKVWWNELWMGYPLGPEYAESSNVTHASKLEGKLFLIVGEMDTNVDPASTMQVVNALIKAKKDFDLLVVPGAGHSIGEAYGRRRRMDYFVRHLLGVEPPDWNKFPNVSS